MEFDIDQRLVTGVVASEYAQARDDIERFGPLEAYRRSTARHDARLAAADDAHTLACRAGCSWCCYFSVDVRAVEVLNILNCIASELPASEQVRVREEVAANRARLESLNEDERVRQNIKCPFLSGGRCVIYAARPQTCRNYHATDAAGCEQSYNEPDNPDIDPEFAPLTYQSGGAHVEAFSQALRQAGFDVAAYELNLALAAAFADPAQVKARFTAGQQPFPGLSGTHVDDEFVE